MHKRCIYIKNSKITIWKQGTMKKKMGGIYEKAIPEIKI